MKSRIHRFTIAAAPRLTPRHIQNRAYPAKVVFHHVPKTAGTSLRSALEWAYLWWKRRPVPATPTQKAINRVYGTIDWDAATGEEILRRLELVQNVRKTLLLYYLSEGARLVDGHIRFSEEVFEAYNKDVNFVTVMRNPTERIISHYLMLTLAGADQLPTKRNLEEFLESSFGQIIANYATFMFDGVSMNQGRMAFSPEHAATNLRRLQLVGIQDDIPQFASKLSALIGRRVNVGYEKSGELRDLARRYHQDKALVTRIGEVAESDWRLYQVATGLR